MISLCCLNLTGQVDLQLGLQGFWELDNNGLDSLGLHTGTIDGTLPTTDRCGVANGAMLFPQNMNSVVRFGDVFDNVIAGANKKFSVSIWIKPPNDISGAHQIITKSADSGCGVDEREWVLRLREGYLYFWFASTTGVGNNRGLMGSTLINNPDMWYHIVAVYDGAQNTPSGRVKLYVNTVLETLTLVENNGNMGNIVNGPAPFSIGAYVISNNTVCLPSSIFEGAIDDARLYNRMLNVAEVQALYHTDCFVDVHQQELNHLQVFPNPSEGVFVISGAHQNAPGKVDVYNQSGQLLKTLPWAEGMRVDLSQYPSGFYFLRATWESGEYYTGKVLKAGRP